MANTGNPFMVGDFKAFDIAGLFDPKTYDPKNLTAQAEKFTEAFLAKGVDTQTVVQSQQKNLEALAAANRVVFEGVQMLTRRHAEIANQNFTKTTAALTELAGVTDPHANLTKQAELMKEAYEGAVANSKELADISAKAHEEAVNLLNARVGELLEEVKAVSKVAAKPAKAAGKA